MTAKRNTVLYFLKSYKNILFALMSVDRKFFSNLKSKPQGIRVKKKFFSLFHTFTVGNDNFLCKFALTFQYWTVYFVFFIYNYEFIKSLFHVIAKLLSWGVIKFWSFVGKKDNLTINGIIENICAKISL